MLGGRRTQGRGRGFFGGGSAPVASLSMRARMAGGSALLAAVVLGVFALVTGLQFADRLHDDRNHDVKRGAQAMQGLLQARASARAPDPACERLSVITEDDDASLRLYDARGRTVCASPDAPRYSARQRATGAFGAYTVSLLTATLRDGRAIEIQYARPSAPLDDTIAHLKTTLALGVLAGTLLAGLLGLLLARLTMNPIIELTAAARDLERHIDGRLKMPNRAAPHEIAQLARTLERTIGVLERSRRAADQRLARERQVIADVSHELRTPLSTLLANLQFLIGRLEGDHGEAGQAALRSALRMRTLLSDTLVSTQLQQPNLTAAEPIDLAQIATAALAEVRLLDNEHHFELHTQPAWILGAANDLHRVVLNLLINAIRHTPPNTTVSITTATTTHHAILIVEDNGPGIPLTLQDNIFERFVHGGAPESTGLGLAIARAVTESHAGTIRLEPPTHPHGARFVLELPALPTPHPPNTPTPHQLRS